MRIMRPVVLIIGILAALMGLVWMGQGSGHFPYPPSSFMIDQSQWIYRGAAMVIVGLAAIYFSRRL